MELGYGGEFINDQFVSPYFDNFSYRSVRDSVLLLDECIGIMKRRQAQMLGVSRLHVPTEDEPYILILLDELGALTAWHGDRKLKIAAATKIALLINQARAFGITIMYAGQDLRKDIAVFRGQTPTRISLRTAEPEDINMLLGNGAWNRGARSDEIPDTMPGTAWVATEGKKGFQRIRFAHHTDTMIQETKPDIDLVIPQQTEWPAGLGGFA